nr:DUF4329 domain-containing protein [Escherichia coli]
MGLLQTWDDARSGACTGGVCGVLSRIIGPSKFDSTADAALDALKETQNRSLCNDMEYSGIVCKDTNGKYFASKAETDNLRKWICPYISRHLLSLNPLQARCRRYSRGERQ